MKITAVDKNEVKSLSLLQPIGWGDIIPPFDFYTKSKFCFPIKITINGEIVGLGATIVHKDVAWLGHIIVHSDHRCKGLGQLITQTLIDIANENNCSTIYLIATEFGEPVYRKKGFIVETEYIFYKDITKVELAISDQIHPYEKKYKDHFSSFDKSVSGEDRMMHLEEYLKNALVYCSGDIVEGYYLPDLGEGLIIADNEQAGIELLKLHLKQKNSVVIPKENEAVQKFFQETIFGERKIMKRMRLGHERAVRFENIYNRIAGNVG